MDLNPLPAGEADSPETARYTSVFQRLQANGLRKKRRTLGPTPGWRELTLQPERQADEVLAYTSRTGRRASDLGTLPIALVDYVKLLKWTAKHLRSGQRSTIPPGSRRGAGPLGCEARGLAGHRRGV